MASLGDRRGMRVQAGTYNPNPLDGLAQDIEDFRHVWVMIGLASADVSVIPQKTEVDKKKSTRRLMNLKAEC